MSAIEDDCPLALKVTHVGLSYHHDYKQKSISNRGTPTILDEDLAEALSATDEIECLLINLTKHLYQ